MIKAIITNIQIIKISVIFTLDIKNDATGEKVQEVFGIEAGRFKGMDNTQLENYIKDMVQNLVQIRIDSIPELDTITGEWKKASSFLNKEFTFDY